MVAHWSRAILSVLEGVSRGKDHPFPIGVVALAILGLTGQAFFPPLDV
jgi:hypothetical protein